MIKEIELWDWESHEHTVVRDLSAGLNLICGESNSGKTSIIRAIRLVAYNEFDPKAVRVGCKNAVVKITTERGYVKVTRGDDNEWEIAKNGEKIQYFSRIGKKILPEAAEIIGLTVVKLGDVEMQVNVMNQLEQHFMLSEMAGKDASGSMRAQVVDEISGLSGIEGLIKGVSLDGLRWGREVKILEDRNGELVAQMHDPEVLASEGELLGQVAQWLKDRDDCNEVASEMSLMLSEHTGLLEKIAETETELAGMPPIDTIKIDIEHAELMLAKADSARVLKREWKKVNQDLAGITAELDAIPETARVGRVLSAAQRFIDKQSRAGALLRDWQKANQDLAGVEAALGSIPDPEVPTKALKVAAKAFERWDAGAQLREEVLIEKHRIDDLTCEIAKLDEELVDARRERDELVATVKVCPLSLHPVSPTCLASVLKTPVTEPVETNDE